MANEVKVKRPIFMVGHAVDVLGVPGTDQGNASGVAFDLTLASGTTPQVHRVDIRNVAITSDVETTFRVNFFHAATRGGTQWRDSTYVGGFDIACASGVPEWYGEQTPSSGIFYGNANNITYGPGVSCYLPYIDSDHIARLSDSDSSQYIHGTIQNVGSAAATNVKIIVLYEPADPVYYV